jgi:GNAT superfamily N-acetyltransferase
VAEHGARVVGVLVLDGDLVDQLYVAPEAQGRGVGSRLLALAKERRPEGLRLWVFVTNTAARAFYEARGFVVAGGTQGEGNEERAPDLLLAWHPAAALAP